MYDYRNDLKEIIASIGPSDDELTRGLQEIHRTLKYLSMLAHVTTSDNGHSSAKLAPTTDTKVTAPITPANSADTPVVFHRKLSGAEINGVYFPETELRQQGLADLPDQSLVKYQNGTITPTGETAGPSQVRVLKKVLVEQDDGLQTKYLARYYNGDPIRLVDDAPIEIALSPQDAQNVSAGDVIDYAWYDNDDATDNISSGKVQWHYPTETVAQRPSVSQRILNERHSNSDTNTTSTDNDSTYEPHFDFELPADIHNVLIVSGYVGADDNLPAVVNAHGGVGQLIRTDKVTSVTSGNTLTAAVSAADAVIICTDYLRHHQYSLIKELCNDTDKSYAVANMSSQIHVERGLYRIAKHLSPVDSNDIEYPS